MKIAIASSGLGHISRGVETWARDTADALHALGKDVTLFSGAPLPKRSGGAPQVAVPCIRRFTPLSRVVVRLMPGFAWRWGLKSGYGLEQLTFWLHLRRLLRQGGFDILHLQDPMVALWCRRARASGRVATKEILAHGTEETSDFLAQFEYVQHLVPYHLETVLQNLDWRTAPGGWCVAPNFVDTSRFSPVESDDQKRAIRRQLGIPENAFVVGSAGAIKRHHKRMDYLVHEFASFCGTDERKQNDYGQNDGSNHSAPNHSAHLVIAGAWEQETDALVAEARQLLGDNVSFLLNHPFEQMPDFYKALDVFVLPSLFEMMGIVFAEAMASGVLAIGHDHPVMQDVIGTGGRCIDMEREGALAAVLADFGVEEGNWRQRARAHVEKEFSKDVVIQKYVDYYKRIIRT